MSQRAMSIDNISFLSPPQFCGYEREIDAGDQRETVERNEPIESSNLLYTDNDQTRLNSPDNQDNDEENNIIPWKKLLRKTNSRLNLIS